MQARVDEGIEITTRAWDRGQGAFRDLRVRRIGLAVSTLIILVLIAGIVMKIREVEATTGWRRDDEHEGREGS